MVFVDTLAFQLFTLVFVSVILFYAGVLGGVVYRRHGYKRTYQHLRAQVVPLAGLGVLVFAIWLWGEITWPLPGSYNILFYDPYTLLGVVLIAFAVSVAFRLRTQYVGVLAGMTGVLSIYYGIAAYNLGMTKDPGLMLLLYIALGGTAFLTFPVTIFLDRLVVEPELAGAQEAPQKAVSLPWKLAFVGFLAFLLFAAVSAILSLTLGGASLPAHLQNPP